MHAICSVDAPNAFGASTDTLFLKQYRVGGSRGCIIHSCQFVTIVGIGKVIYKAISRASCLPVSLQLLDIAVSVIFRHLFRVADRLFRHTKRNTT